MPNTYVALRTETVAIATPSITLDLTGISGYTNLRVVLNGGATSYGGLRMRYNGDTAANYSDTFVLGAGTSTTTGRDTTAGVTYLSGGYPLTTTVASMHTIDIFQYANTGVNKSSLGRSSDAGGISLAQAGLWQSNAAITSILLYPASGNFVVGTTVSLYGIANADQGAAKATGGIITEDSQYWYHTFGASGAFIPKQSLTCDVLVVAGGGGGGVSYGAGGGGGGVIYFAGETVSTSQNITVGAGGPGKISPGGAGSNGVNSTFAALTAAVGGGGGGGNNGGAIAGVAGGSGGGGGATASTFAAGGSSTQTGTGATAFYGNAGGTGMATAAGGGGGAGGAGGAATGGKGGAGGAGTSVYSSWGITTGTGVNVSGTYYYAGGGTGNGASGVIAPNAGGTAFGTPAAANTGAGGYGDAGTTASNGASGVVIIRYSK